MDDLEQELLQSIEPRYDIIDPVSGNPLESVTRDDIEKTFGKKNAGDIIINAVKRDALIKIDALHAAAFLRLTDSATKEEVATWQPKALAAASYLNDSADAAQTVMIETEAQILGVTPSDLCNVILAKSAAYLKLVGALSGVRTIHRDAIRAAKSEADIHAATNAAQSAFDAIS